MTHQLHGNTLVPPHGLWYGSGMASDICANITGTVWKIEVAEGEQVASGQTVVILESMKMELPIEAEDSGTVTKIHVAEGQPVEQGQRLMTLG